MNIKRIAIFVFFMQLCNVCYSCKKDSSLVIGEFKIRKVTDGDTFRFDNLDRPVRLLGIDTEETFKTDDAEQKTNEIAKHWEEFYKMERDGSLMPVKTDSPFGYEAWKWAEGFFKDVDYVRLEREGDGRDEDMFGRYLVYLIAVKNGQEINYNVECIRQGYSPYFNKYGNSLRFNDEFVLAQEYARNNKLGIWDANKLHYPDYDERLKWWNKRAEELETYKKVHSSDESYFNLSVSKDFDRLEESVGKEIIIFGGISDILTKKFPYLMRIPVSKEKVFEIVVHEEDSVLLQDLNMDLLKEYYIYMKGVLEKYNGKYQMTLKSKDQIWRE